jgi:hypothetical protein
MKDHSIRYSARASLAGVGAHMRRLGLWTIIGTYVQIKQKAITHTPLDKLLDAFINILAGGHGLVEVNKRVRRDRALQRAFGRDRCADQSTISETLNRCTEENIVQMRQSLKVIYRSYSQGYQHPYEEKEQVLDVDMTGLPAGRQGEGVEKGFFSGKRNCRGRQLGRVFATLHDEIVVDCLYPGKRQLERSLQPLVERAEQVLDLDESRRRRTIIRCDGGGGRDADINWLLNRGYGILIKVKNWQRARKLAQSVATWHLDPKTGDREVGWVEAPHAYDKPTRQLAVRIAKKAGGYHYLVLVCNLSDRQLLRLARQDLRQAPTPTQVLFAALYAYDLRGGGVETSIKGSKQGLGLNKRNKKRFPAQEMLVLLAQLAYNLIVWTRNRLAEHSPKLRRFGPLRMVRDIFGIDGCVHIDAHGVILKITLNQADEFAQLFAKGWPSLACPDDLCLNLGQI